MLPGAALGSLAARFCWQGQHFRLWTVPERVSGACQAQHLAASRLVSAGRGSTSGSGRYPSAFRGPPPCCCQAQRLVSARRGSTSGSARYPSAFRGPLPEPRGSFLLAGAALQALEGTRARLQALDGTRARFGAPPPRCCQAQHLGASLLASPDRGKSWTVPERVSGPGAALGSLAARFCWQGQHFRLWTVPERVSGRLLDAARRSTRLVSARRGSTSGSARYPSAFRCPPP